MRLAFKKISFALFQDTLIRIFGALSQNKKTLLRLSIAFIFITITAFSFEYFGFGSGDRTLETQSTPSFFPVSSSAIIMDGFSKTDNNLFSAQSENASLTVKNDGHYVGNFIINLPEHPNYGIIVSYQDPQTNENIVLEKKFKRSMAKNDLDFLRQLVFPIRNTPDKIIVSATNENVKITSIHIDNTYHFNAYRFALVFSIILLAYIFFVLRERIGMHPEYGFFAVALICGTLLIFSEPLSYVSWDEFIHYKRANNLSFKEILPEKVKNHYAQANSVPASYSSLEQTTINAYFNHDYKNSAKKTKQSKDTFSFMHAYDRISYIPTGITLFIARAIQIPSHIAFLLGRWTQLLLFSTIVFFAIRKVKSGKVLMASIALLPTSIFLASNYGYDSWLTAFLFFGLAYLFSELQQPEKKISFRQIAPAIVFFVIGCGPKAIYFPVLFLLFLLGRKKFLSENQYKKFLLAVCASIVFVLGSFMLPLIISGPGDGDSRGGSEVSATKQVQFIISHPFEYAQTLLSFTIEYLGIESAKGYTVSFAYLGNIRGFFILLGTLLIVAFSDSIPAYDKKIASPRVWLLGASVCLSTILLICTALYISFTAVGSETIAGVQSRYLIPLLFPALFILSRGWIHTTLERNSYTIIVFGIFSSILFLGIWDLAIKWHYA